MSIKERITKDLTESMKRKDAGNTEALRLIRAEILNLEKSSGTPEATDEALLPVLQRMVKQRKDSIEQFRAGNREDLVEKEQRQIEVIERYLPESAGKDEIRGVAIRLAKELGATAARDLGKVMGPTMKELRVTGKAIDGGLVREVVQAVLMELEEGSLEI